MYSTPKTQNKKQSQNSNEKQEQQRIIEYEYNIHRQLMKKFGSSGKAFQKISKSYYEIKTHILTICQMLQGDIFTGICSNSSKTLLENICQINASIADLCYQYFNQFQSAINMYSEITKQKLQRYKQQKHNFNHYAEKMGVLSRVTDKDRYERNKEKKRAAESAYDRTSKQYQAYLRKINQEAQKIWQKNFIGFVSIYITKSSQMVYKAKQSMEKFQESQEDIIVIEEDFQLGLSPATSFNENAHLEALAEQIHSNLAIIIEFMSRDRLNEQKIVLSPEIFEVKKQQKQNKIKKQQNSNVGNKNLKMAMSLNTNFLSVKNNLNIIQPPQIQENHSVNVQKLFGITKKPEPLSFSKLIDQNNFIAKVNNYSSNQVQGQKSQLKVPQKNMFSLFDNIYCEKSKSPIQRPRDKTPPPPQPVFTLLAPGYKSNIQQNQRKYSTNKTGQTQKADPNKKKQQINLLDL